MEKRFTAKDFVILAILSLIVILILLAMYMVDRQWLKIAEIQQTVDEQAQDLRGLRSGLRSLDRRIQQGVVTGSAPTTNLEKDIPPTFERAVQASRQPDFAEGDWLVQAFGSSLKTVTPLVSQDAYASEVQQYVLESLVTRNPSTLEWQGLIARDWTISEDGLTFNFRLRDDVKFSDGKPLTAEDIEFTFNFIMNEKIAAPRQRAYLKKIKSVKANGKYAVTFVFSEPYFNAMSLAGGLNILPRHFYEPYLEDPQKFNQSKGLLLGSGPYRLRDPKGWTPDKGLIELERNPRYWGPVEPNFRRLLWQFIENDNARLTTFRNGDIDAYSARPLEFKRLLNDDKLTQRANHWEYMSPVVGYSYIGWNQSRNGKETRFADKRVRQAMTYLTDRERTIKEIFLGYAEIAISPFNPRSKQHDPSLQPRPVDIDKAKTLLAEAGYVDRDGDGVLENEAGQDFSFELVYFQDAEDTKRTVLFLKDLYAKAGILLQPKPTEWSVMIDLLTRRDFEAITLGWTSGVETDIYQIFHSSQIEDNADNFVSYKNPELDKLIDKARATVDEAKRMPLWQACERILVEDQPYTFLMRRKSLVFIDKRFRNIEVTRLGLSFGFVPIENYVPAELQRYQR